MASQTKSTLTTVAIIFLLIQLDLLAESKPVSPDPNRCFSDPESDCCPRPVPKTKIVDFKLQSKFLPVRVRRPAHALTIEEAKKYERATELMRALPDDHPWSFVAQANVHCVYCSGGYYQQGHDVRLEIHNSWHFFTWHRAYLYFYERILGKLINDTSFALPFWNWDDPSGMSIPPIYRTKSSSLFNPTRYPDGLKFINLGACKGNNSPKSLPKQKQCNLRVMHRQFITGFNSSLLFFGSPYRASDPPYPGGGPIESAPHGPIHIGTSSDMTYIDTAARDPIFFAHHGNVDRLWTIWDSLSNKKNRVVNDRDFLDASFLFWDENMQFVRIFVRDIIDTSKLGYVYEKVPLKWMNMKTLVEKEGIETVFVGMDEGNVKNRVSFPLKLISNVSVNVRRKVGNEEEKLVVSGIELDGRDYVWFKVYIGKVGGGRVEAGCFIHLERRGSERSPMVTKLQIGITQFIEEIGAKGDDWVVVTLVPNVAGDKVIVGGVAIV